MRGLFKAVALKLHKGAMLLFLHRSRRAPNRERLPMTHNQMINYFDKTIICKNLNMFKPLIDSSSGYIKLPGLRCRCSFNFSMGLNPSNVNPG